MKPAELQRLFGINHQALHVNLKGLTDEDSRVQPHTGGNCLNWVVGHIVASRNGILVAMGNEMYWPKEEAVRYARGSAPITGPGDGKPFEQLVEAFDRTQERIQEGLARMTEAELDAPRESDTVGGWISFLHFHEAYHIGQAGLLRRIAGKEGAIR